MDKLTFLALMASLAVGYRGAAAEPQVPGDAIPTEDGTLIVHPINHATFTLHWKNQAIYVDPVGGAEKFKGIPKPTLILITDIHGDHFHPETLSAIAGEKTSLVAPQAVAEKLPDPLRARAIVLANGEKKSVGEITIEAIPMYNLTADRLQYHEKGRGNGYVITAGGKRVYISGDTEDIPEMRALKDIDLAFVCMNLPYTMTVEQAASAVREFKPKIVCPYHYRGSNVEKFKQLVSEDPNIEVRLRNWY